MCIAAYGIHFGFNEFLDWNSHTIKISNKLSKAIGIMHKLRKIIPMKILKLMYSSMILPHLYFGITVWGFTCRRVYGLQKKAIRIITKSKFNAHTEPLFRDVLLTNTTSAQNCIRQYVPRLITSMTVLVISKVNTHSYIGFSNYVKQHLIGLYRYECLIPNCYIICAQR